MVKQTSPSWVKAKLAYFKNHPDMVGEKVNFPRTLKQLNHLNKHDRRWT